MSTDEFFDTWSPRMLSVLRIVAAFLFIMHGTAKLFGVPHQPQFDNLQLMSQEGLQGILEFAGGMLLLVGFLSRPVAFILSGDMAVAYFMAHFPKAFLPILNGGDLAVLFCFVFFYLFFAGGGPWSIDALIRTPLRARKAEAPLPGSIRAPLPGSIRRQPEQSHSSRTL
jgi:putative oxidoreductase